MSCSEHKYEVEFSMKDNTIVCSGVDRVRNSTISCELKVGDTLVLTERGIHSCISIKTVPIKIKEIFKVSLSSTENEKMYKATDNIFLRDDIRDILDNPKNIHKVLEEVENVEESYTEIQVRTNINTLRMLQERKRLLQIEYAWLDEKEYEKIYYDSDEHFADIKYKRKEYRTSIKQDLKETLDQIKELVDDTNKMIDEIKEDREVEDEEPKNTQLFNSDQSIVIIGKREDSGNVIIFLNLEPTKPWNHNWRTINFCETIKENAENQKRELEKIHRQYTRYKWFRSKSKSKMYKILLYQKEHKFKMLQKQLLHCGSDDVTPYELNIGPVDTPTRSRRSSRRSSSRSSRRSTRRSSSTRQTPRTSVQDAYRQSVMDSIETPRATRKNRFNIFNLFGRN